MRDMNIRGHAVFRGGDRIYSVNRRQEGYIVTPLEDDAFQYLAVRFDDRMVFLYKIPDDRVVCHSHVAYGAPNKWQKKNHRGRKRCGMLFAMPSVRAQLNLARRPAGDADVRAKRLVVGDDYLRRVLYGNVDTMKASYPKTSATPSGQEAGGGIFAWLRGGAKSPEKEKAQISAKDPPPPKPRLVPAPPPPKPVAAHPPTGVPQAPPKSIAELKARGYTLKGSVTKSVTASKIAGGRWNSKDTYYTIRNKVIPGSEIDPAHIEVGMGVWMK